MQWELSTPVDLEKMAKEEKLCIVPIGVLERHGEHLPLGTDALIAHKIAVEAAKIEPCMVFPPYWFGQVHEATHSPGSFVLESDFTITLLQNICDEIGRNGFTKIMFVNGHGGNGSMLTYFLFSTMDRHVPYTLYSVMYDSGLTPDERAKAESFVMPDGGHADQWETSLVMSVAPESVKMEYQRFPEPVKGLGRVGHLGRVFTPYSWYASYPEHVTGTPSLGTKEAGDKLMELYIERLAKDIKAVKEDTVVPSFQKEFFERADKYENK
ncbi:MAG: creatininase family protein [Clostridia bacterium]|nr:creatininase family protein [Clostridia bacterium]